MIRNTQTTTEELQMELFIKKYQPAKFKNIKAGIEIRGVVDVDYAANKASELIKDLKVDLIVVKDANMASYKAFEVLYTAAVKSIFNDKVSILET